RDCYPQRPALRAGGGTRRDERAGAHRERSARCRQPDAVLRQHDRRCPALSVGEKPESVPEQLAKLRERTASALAEMRTLLLELRPLELEHIELKRAIAQLVQSINGRMKTPVTLEVNGECAGEALPTEVKVAFYRIAQEALNNVAKHASTKCAGVNLTCHENGARLTVWDEGEGFDMQAVPPGHMGLRIMRERAEAVGAAFSLASQPGAG